MSYDVEGRTIAADANGYLSNPDDWNEAVAAAIAAAEDITLTAQHWDILNYLRSEFFDNHGNQPNMRTITKAMQTQWNDKAVDSKQLYTLFPKDPSKQGGKIAGLPESRRKGGY